MGRETSLKSRRSRAAPGASTAGLLDEPIHQFALIVMAALLAQGLSFYSIRHVRIGAGFFPVTLLARTVLPLFVAWIVLRIPLIELGFGRPQNLERKHWGILGAVVILLPLVAIQLLQLDAYQDHYAQRRRATPDFAANALRFTLFTVSTTIPWEILHRGVLLHTSRRSLQRAGLPLAAASIAAIVVTQSFETLFHFAKPPLEAIAMGLASPMLSWMAFRTRSIWIPLLLHLEVEVLFFLFVLA